MSDHRPVRAIFRAQVEIIDVATRNNIKSSISQNSTPFVTSSPRPSDRPEYPHHSTAAPLIDFSEEAPSAAAFPAAGSLFPGAGAPVPVRVNPSNHAAPTQWWQVPVDETWILDEGDATNPFVANNRL
ncbi:hypothetical protein BC830DRAFT_361722 [Chytriomyces sp. MP71]|nr:hypothetical protein BC830DRAFT_361722 [Chytriomyces sp. MP71]